MDLSLLVALMTIDKIPTELKTLESRFAWFSYREENKTISVAGSLRYEGSKDGMDVFHLCRYQGFDIVLPRKDFLELTRGRKVNFGKGTLSVYSHYFKSDYYNKERDEDR